MPEHFDVIVIGGSAAGLSAALILGRSRRSVLVVDSGEPRNAPAAGAHNYLGHEGVAPAELLRIGRDEVAAYGVQGTAGRIVATSATTGDGHDPVGFSVTLNSGEVVTARRLVVASGAVDVLPEVPGLAEQWGRGVVHCPFCHGWEIRDQRIGVLVTTPNGAHHALMFRALSDRVTAFLTDPALMDDTALAGLAARGISVIEGPVAAVVSEGDRLTGVRLTGVRLADGSFVELDALATASRPEARVAFLSGLGLAATDQFIGDHRFATALTVDAVGQTAVRGVYAAGNVTAPMATVIASAAAGTQTGAAVHGDLVQADLAAALAGMGACVGAGVPTADVSR
ncbi:NAD(P)/FAD-dependent oxidoreductase [Curtobacterium flaccumfaciens]|uniref:NAD(P)/FAD-dependent oxidoreductase n=1 Tax=Curtobacterium flaccumfaciens TaxID=2035 RepID=UPI00188B2436|nr:NAD(P)/FAD-dependent oxidoreductase [Curtobacterium flaccumfaciens]MBF4625946.1 NAD(P)/FAD-dependent oxidoreductase [Curtobacterium flaccumfaciens]